MIRVWVPLSGTLLALGEGSREDPVVLPLLGNILAREELGDVLLTARAFDWETGQALVEVDVPQKAPVEVLAKLAALGLDPQKIPLNMLEGLRTKLGMGAYIRQGRKQ